VGGHTVDDEEPKYGLCVNGVVHPDRIITNAGARTGDALILTKPLGSGVLFNAVRSGKFSFAKLEREVLPWLAALNGPAMETALRFDLHACTDITGFGILGHLLEMAHGCGRRIIVQHRELAFFPGALDMYRKGQTTGSNKANRAMVAKHHFDRQLTLSEAEDELLYDPQTSGGLMLAVPAAQAEELLSALHVAGVREARRIGEVVDRATGLDLV
jgi:selenide, water dikinase